MSSERLSFRAYARRRGVTHAAVSKAVTEGRITAGTDKETGKRYIDPAVADPQWEASTDQAKQAGSAAVATKKRESDVMVGDLEEGEEGPATSTYMLNRSRREHFQARITEINYLERAGQVVSADAVKKQAFRAARLAREALLGIPDRLAPELAGVSEPKVIHKRLTEEITRALEAIANEI